ncbi:T-cell surface glycoprotein CD1b-3-like isoform X1 [Anser cygnoides]|uniref:Ig-like domain-containing protein n=1 Tax=Anser cygnoides TaxID=8845 RepID=A0A8B9EP66_ANSCY|nr:T-cell surface glycoprotein CD1b-3-like isoform X1 [Anser cygnoides]XP_047911971.1 T-cell surface glycoprotein CD1b-3-like isoform X1 [Anser cygnoides]
MSASSSRHPDCFSLTPSTMRPHHLLFLLLILFCRTWAEPEAPSPLPAESQLFQLLQTFLLPSADSTEVAGVAVLADMIVYSLDPDTWNVHICYPWVHQAMAEGDVAKLMSSFKLGERNVIRFMHEMVKQVQAEYPVVFQLRAGCELHPNGTSRAFAKVGEGGRDLVEYEVGRGYWALQQSTLLAKLVGQSLNGMMAVTEMVEHLLYKSCPSHLRALCRHGRADLERQEPPTATVFARTAGPAQLLLVCRITGFYPRPISVAWLRDGHEVPPGPALNTSAVLPNANLTYQVYSVLTVAPRDGHSYACRVRHRSLGTRSLLIPWENPIVTPTVIIVIVVLVLAVAIAIGAAWWWRYRKGAVSGQDPQQSLI